jgi:hypothetical protein
MNSNTAFSSSDTVRQSAMVFNAKFSQFEVIRFTQAWSLFFTGGRIDTALGQGVEIGWFFNYTTLAIVAMGILLDLKRSVPNA